MWDCGAGSTELAWGWLLFGTSHPVRTFAVGPGCTSRCRADALAGWGAMVAFFRTLPTFCLDSCARSALSLACSCLPSHAAVTLACVVSVTKSTCDFLSLDFSPPGTGPGLVSSASCGLASTALSELSLSVSSPHRRRSVVQVWSSGWGLAPPLSRCAGVPMVSCALTAGESPVGVSDFDFNWSLGAVTP